MATSVTEQLGASRMNRGITMPFALAERMDTPFSAGARVQWAGQAEAAR